MMSGSERSSRLILLYAESSGGETRWMDIKGWKGAKAAITELHWMLVWYHSEWFWIARTWEFIMKICSFTTRKTSFSWQVVVSVHFSLSSFDPRHLQQQRWLEPHMETQCRLTHSYRGCRDFMRCGPGAGVVGKYLKNEALLFFVLLFWGWIKRFHRLDVLKCLGSCMLPLASHQLSQNLSTKRKIGF